MKVNQPGINVPGSFIIESWSKSEPKLFPWYLSRAIRERTLEKQAGINIMVSIFVPSAMHHYLNLRQTSTRNKAILSVWAF